RADWGTEEILKEAESQQLQVWNSHDGYSNIYLEPGAILGWKFPANLGAGILHLSGAEAGGLVTEEEVGSAIVITGLKGERLRIFHMGSDEYEQRCGSHAWFAEAGQLTSVAITAEAVGGLEHCVIARQQIDVQGDAIRVREINLWKGEPAKLPDQ